LAATLIAKQPRKFGFDVELETPVDVDVVRIEGQTDLRILARLGEIDPETLRQLNPHLRRGMTPPGVSTDVSVPAGLADVVAEAYANLPAGERLVIARHQVAKGESIGAIAHHYGVPASAISTANRLGKGAAVRPGQELIIPAVAAPASYVDGARTGAVVYRVRRGDTLSRIAARYRSSASAIARASGISIHSNLRVGQRLVVPARRSSGRAPVATARVERGEQAAHPASPVVHTVRRGETLYRIAGRYQVTVNQICSLNSITPDGVLYPGTRLKIRTN
jgi:LysM repeat protein